VKITVRRDGTLICEDKIFRCALGRQGVGRKCAEGDGITPVGTYPLRRVLYRADRLSPPVTLLPIAMMEKNDGWCDDPQSPLYNQQIKKPFPASHETLYRDDSLYDIIVVIGYNDHPIITGKGSAIFIHVAQPHYEPTEGCIALSLSDLLEVLALCGTETEIEIC